MSRRLVRLALLGLALAATSAAAGPAAASVTIGQLAPTNIDPSTFCADQVDWPQPTVISGNTYVVPELPPAGALSVISWSTNAQPGPGQMLTMKIFRKVADPDTYVVVGHDGPRDLVGGTVNTFPTSIPVKTGDVLGINSANAASVHNLCAFHAPGEPVQARGGDLADGQSADFPVVDSEQRANATAVVAPTNRFALGAVTRNQKKGAATLNFNLPNPGDLTGSGNGANVASAAGARISKSVTPGPAQLVIKAKGKKKRKLNQKGKVKLNLAVTYTPTGGEPSTQSVAVKLKKKL